VQDGATCCYALQDKVWVTGPGGERWEVYTVLADVGAEHEGKTSADVGSVAAASGADAGCCGSDLDRTGQTPAQVCCAG
jgi:hypothetical protein